MYTVIVSNHTLSSDRFPVLCVSVANESDTVIIGWIFGGAKNARPAHVIIGDAYRMARLMNGGMSGTDAAEVCFLARYYPTQMAEQFRPCVIVCEDEGDFEAEQGDDAAKNQAWEAASNNSSGAARFVPTDEQYYAHFQACQRMGVSFMSPSAPTIEEWLRDGDRAFFQ